MDEPARLREAPHPFASWASDGRTLRVFVSLDHNGQELASAVVAEESPERIVVAVTRREPVGPTTLVAGSRPAHADLVLRAPVGQRVVVDASCGAPRPSLGGVDRA